MGKKKKKNYKKKPWFSAGFKLFLIIILIPICFIIYYSSYIVWQQISKIPLLAGLSLTETEKLQANFDLKIPDEYIPIYIAAGKEYNVPWTLLAAHHRVETRFSTMNTLISPVGAEGHMQFMPCTFVGWSHPTCSGLGEGDIPESEKTNPEIIYTYGGYGVDANRDGKADPFQLEDAIYSAANYLSASGASNGDLETAIYHYNHSEEYVEEVLNFYHQYESVSRELENLIWSDNE